MDDIIALGQPTFGDDEMDAVRQVLASNWVAGNGPHSRSFEEAFATACGTRHALAVNNCTAALHLALLALDVGAGDEVIVADYTFPATGHAVMFTGAVPRFADVSPVTFTIDPEAAEALVNERTRGIVAVDAFGQCADYDELRTLADRHGLFVVEDAAASAGATYRGRPSGGLGDIGCFSFHGRKGITCGEGGALTTDRDDIASFARKAHAFGIESAYSRQNQADLPVPVFDLLGYNYKLSDLAAAIMEVQLRRLGELLKLRRSVAEHYFEVLSDVDEVTLPRVAPDRDHTWQAFPVLLDRSLCRGEVALRLREQGIQANFGTYACHVQPVYASSDRCAVSADLFDRHLTIPMHANLTVDQVERVSIALRTALTN